VKGVSYGLKLWLVQGLFLYEQKTNLCRSEIQTAGQKEVATIIKIAIYDDIKEQNKEIMETMNLQIFLYASICRPVYVNEHCKYYQ